MTKIYQDGQKLGHVGAGVPWSRLPFNAVERIMEGGFKVDLLHVPSGTV
jgi:hypothetical protein